MTTQFQIPANATILDLPQGVPLSGQEPIETVQNGQSVQVSAAAIAALGGGGSGGGGTEIISFGATVSNPYLILPTDGKVLFNKSIGAPSFAQAGLSSLANGSVLIKDLKGDASSNPITVNFTSGELCDGQASVVIDTDYGWVTINPMLGGGSWYQS